MTRKRFFMICLRRVGAERALYVASDYELLVGRGVTRKFSDEFPNLVRLRSWRNALRKRGKRFTFNRRDVHTMNVSIVSLFVFLAVSLVICHPRPNEKGGRPQDHATKQVCKFHPPLLGYA
jgi:hypothetical protein